MVAALLALAALTISPGAHCYDTSAHGSACVGNGQASVVSAVGDTLFTTYCEHASGTKVCFVNLPRCRAFYVEDMTGPRIVLFKGDCSDIELGA